MENLYLYPVKSLAGVRVPELTVSLQAGSWQGLTDRNFMVTDTKGKMVTARRYPGMTQIKAREGEDGSLVLSHPDAEDMVIRPKTIAGGTDAACLSLDVWGDACRGQDLGPEAGRWLSRLIAGNPDAGFRLVHHADGESSRPDKPVNAHLSPLGRSAVDRPYYADGYPFMLMTRPSVENLSQELAAAGITSLHVEETRFRPNIYVAGDFPAFAEDQWAFIKIGTAVFRNTSPCTRCLFTTVDPFKGEKDPAGQPLKLLRTYRACEDPLEKAAYGTSPCMGINLGVEVEGSIRAGDPVYVTMGQAEAR